MFSGQFLLSNVVMTVSLILNITILIVSDFYVGVFKEISHLPYTSKTHLIDPAELFIFKSKRTSLIFIRIFRHLLQLPS